MLWFCQHYSFASTWGIPEENPVLIYLDSSALLSVAAFLSTILMGVIYHYVSTKWVKCAWGEPTFLCSKTIERLLDCTFWLMVISFLVGLVALLMFIARG